MSKSLQLAAVLLLSLLIAACSPPAPESTTTPVAARADATAAAEASVEPVQAVEASPSPAPTNTPAPTATQESTSTPTTEPTSTATSTPIPTTAPLPTPTFTAANAMGGNGAGCTPFVDCDPEPAPPSKVLEDTQNILLLGTDLRKGDHLWHTDTMLLVSVDRVNRRVGMLSFPRDYFLYIPGYTSPNGRKFDRINVVDFSGEYGVGMEKHKDGGFGLLKDVFAHNFGIRVDNVVRLHRQGFVDIVNALDGVDVSLECELWELSPTEGRPGFVVGGEPFYVLHVPAGANKLDGETALNFVTYRRMELDYGRSRRQHAFLSAFKQQFIRPETLTQVPALWRAFKDYFQTDLGFRDIAALASLAANLDTQAIHSRVIDGTVLDSPPLKTQAYFSVSKGNAVFQVIEGLFDGVPAADAAKPAQGCYRPNWADAYLATLDKGAAQPAPAQPAAATSIPEPATSPEPAATEVPAATAVPEATEAPEATPEPTAAPESAPTTEATAQPGS